MLLLPQYHDAYFVMAFSVHARRAFLAFIRNLSRADRGRDSEPSACCGTITSSIWRAHRGGNQRRVIKGGKANIKGDNKYDCCMEYHITVFF